jgi:hypothetical protein
MFIRRAHCAAVNVQPDPTALTREDVIALDTLVDAALSGEARVPKAPLIVALANAQGITWQEAQAQYERAHAKLQAALDA